MFWVLETFLDFDLFLPESIALGVFKMLFFMTEDLKLDFLFRDYFLDTREVFDFVTILFLDLLNDILLIFDLFLTKLFLLTI
jgi:hypothetical protein